MIFLSRKCLTCYFKIMRSFQMYAGNNTSWNDYIKKQIKQWSNYFTSWLADGITKGHPIHVVKFENLKLDTLKEVKDMLDFLRFEYEEEELSARIKTDFNTFHRCVLVIEKESEREGGRGGERERS